MAGDVAKIPAAMKKINSPHSSGLPIAWAPLSANHAANAAVGPVRAAVPPFYSEESFR
jgi:hypothetical protein